MIFKRFPIGNITLTSSFGHGTIFGEEQPAVRLLRQELNSWKGFVEALKNEDKEIAHEMMERCMKYVEAIEQSGKEYLTEPFFLSILLDQQKKIRAFEGEMEKMRDDVGSWKESSTGDIFVVKLIVRPSQSLRHPLIHPRILITV